MDLIPVEHSDSTLHYAFLRYLKVRKNKKHMQVIRLYHPLPGRTGYCEDYLVKASAKKYEKKITWHGNYLKDHRSPDHLN